MSNAVRRGEAAGDLNCFEQESCKYRSQRKPLHRSRSGPAPFRGGFGVWLRRGFDCLLIRCFLRVEGADRLSVKVAQPARRVKDKRLRRAFGILDTVRWLGFLMVKGLLPTPVKQG